MMPGFLDFVRDVFYRFFGGSLWRSFGVYCIACVSLVGVVSIIRYVVDLRRN